ncbi:vasorin b [Syngnathoides biaculeatus]|uniref:vasorin b n=1 Tax=Syngnathoides biaculeatus TaxID=300417 RepID=UPI002ADDE466|nr:vasorin b [Syngnathoides biaculeatus]XP_061701779.1 vasorin b [Syngnathoides biaculeatus]
MCTMKVFLPLLSRLLIVLAIPGAVLSSECPKDCSCSTPDSILCFQRRSAAFPQRVPAVTRSLYLFANGIEGLSAQDFDGLENLEMLDLSQNKLTELSDGVFLSLTSLKNLDLSSNQITHISEECFQDMVLLERLYLYSNHIKTIHPAAFNGLKNLLELKLQGNRLTSLPVLAMPQLLLLDLRFNVLPTLGPSDLQTPNLESLKLGGVGLTDLNSELIGSLKNLHELDVSRNQLEVLPPILKEISGLIYLNLAGNPMGTLKFQDLKNLEELKELDISSLSLQGLPEDFAQLFPHLRKLTVAENPFNCLCTLAWLPGWLRGQSIALERTEETRCHFPPINAGKVVERLEHRDFGCPTTTTQTKTTVKTTAAVPVTTLESTTTAVPVPKVNDDSASKDPDSLFPPLPASPSSSSSMDSDDKQHFCPPQTCLNGGTCHLDQFGQVECTCPRGTSGFYCEVESNDPPSLPEPDVFATTVTPHVPDISSRRATSTSILLDLHRFIEMRPYIRGIRLTYRNLSGPDRRPMQLSLPASYPEYRLRGLNPNSTYTICASPLGAPNGIDSVCTQAHTADEKSDSVAGAQIVNKKMTTMLVPAMAILLLLVLIATAVGVVCFVRKKRANGHLDLDREPSQLELDGVKAGVDNGALPQKQAELMLPEPAVQNGNLEYEVLLLQDHCISSKNLSSHKPSYF